MKALDIVQHKITGIKAIVIKVDPDGWVLVQWNVAHTPSGTISSSWKKKELEIIGQVAIDQNSGVYGRKIVPE